MSSSLVQVDACSKLSKQCKITYSILDRRTWDLNCLIYLHLSLISNNNDKVGPQSYLT